MLAKGNAWVLALALIMGGPLVLAGCGGGGGGDEDTQEDSTPDITEVTDSIPDPTTEPPEDTPDVTDDDAGGDCTAMGVTGDACTLDTDCCGVPSSTRICLTDILSYVEFPGGYCSSDGCLSDDECGPDGECFDAMGYLSYCLKPCTDDSDCRESEGYACLEVPVIGGGPYCMPDVELPDFDLDGFTDVPADTTDDFVSDIPTED